MSFDTNWDVDYYKTDYESDEHWELRRSFMTTHKDKFPEDELVCLAQVFTNVEFLGCRYPEETMRRVGLLSQDVASDFRKSRANKLKRTFVGAQDAAGAKAKGRRKNEESNNTPHKSTTSTKYHQQADENVVQFVGFSQGSGDYSSPPKHPKPELNLKPNKYNNLVLFDTIPNQSSFNILQTSVAKNKSTFTCTVQSTNGKILCTAFIDDCEIVQAEGDSKQEAREAVCTRALEYLRKICYSIKQKGSKQTINIDGSQRKTTDNTFKDNIITSENRGFKMMKLMGWTGGALGLDKSGRDEPITVSLNVGRSGLGTEKGVKLDYQFFRNYLTKYATDDTNIHELVFSSEYTQSERLQLHKIAAQLGLKSGSKNSGADRYLTITKKISPKVMAKDILNGGIYAQQFDVIEPTQD